MQTPFFRIIAAVLSTTVLAFLMAKAQGCGNARDTTPRADRADNGAPTHPNEATTTNEEKNGAEPSLAQTPEEAARPQTTPVADPDVATDATEEHRKAPPPRQPAARDSNNSGAMRIEVPASKSGIVFYPDSPIDDE